MVTGPSDSRNAQFHRFISVERQAFPAFDMNGRIIIEKDIAVVNGLFGLATFPVDVAFRSPFNQMVAVRENSSRLLK